MPLARLQPASNPLHDWPSVRRAIQEHHERTARLCRRAWGYYANPELPRSRLGPDAPARRFQEQGLPARITGLRASGFASTALPGAIGVRREVVIENDIAWRVQTMIDFLFGGTVKPLSTARTPAQRELVERLLDAIWERSGGIALLQDAALLGHVHGWVDLLLRIDEAALLAIGGEGSTAGALGARAEPEFIERIAAAFRVEIIEPTRGAPVLNASDYRVLDAYVLGGGDNEQSEGFWRDARTDTGWRERAMEWMRGRRSVQSSNHAPNAAPIEVLTPGERAVWSRGRIVLRESSSLLPGVLPIVHIQNLSIPFRYAGQGEVEPLIGLQDELNTRLSDRAHRVAMQSFRMYLAKGLDGFGAMPVAPGQIWSTDNPDASIESFGGDATSPSEERHIAELREAMDKLSGVPPLAGGVVQGRIGNLSSGTALRVTLMALLGKTERKRVTYGAGLERLSRLMLDAVAAAGVLDLDEQDRGVRIRWPESLPVDEEERVRVAQGKRDLGVPRDVVLAELGYGSADAGVA